MNLEGVERNLRLAERRRKEALGGAYVGTWEWDIVTNALWWDQGMLDIYDIDASDFNGTYDDWTKRVHPDDLQKAVKSLRECMVSNARYYYEFRVWHQKAWRKVVGAGNCIHDADGKPLRITGINILTP